MEQEAKIKCFECGKDVSYSAWYQNMKLAAGYGCNRHE